MGTFSVISLFSSQGFLQGFLTILALVFSLTFHEFCHAWVADRLGDPTARFKGRISMNPMVHFDLFGTLALLLIGIGWGKPVPVNPHNFRSPRRDNALVALAGPFSNFLTAVLAAIPIKYLAGTAFQDTPGYALLTVLFWVSVWIFSLNVLPFPPLDGSKIIGVFIPDRWLWEYERYLEQGPRYFMIFVLIDIFLIERIFGISILSFIIEYVAQWVSAIVSLGT